MIKTGDNLYRPVVYSQTAKRIIKEWVMLLNNRYLIQDSIGKGMMATIYRGTDTHTDQVIAVKVLRDTYSADPKFVKLFQNEAKVMSLWHHPNIIQVYDYGQIDDTYFIIMELIEGIDLRRYLRSRGILDAESAVKIAQNVALGLGAAHCRSIVHRNVKPQNILLGRDSSIKLTDFSLAHRSVFLYISPEQAQGEIVTPASDIYAMGIVMYEMLTGHPPFDGDSPVRVAMQHIQDVAKPPSQFNPNIPTALEEIIMRCLEKAPEMRFRDGSQLARALESLIR
jgi:serine/threonine protein kinase